MNPILNALNSGYGADEILGFLTHSVPQMAKPIRKAQRLGYQTNQILGFLSKNFEKEDRRGLSQSARHAINSRADAERAKFGLKAIGTAIAAPLAGMAVRGALSSLPGMMGGSQAAQPGVQQAAPMIPGAVPPINPQVAKGALQRAAPQLTGPGAIPGATQGLPKPQPQAPVLGQSIAPQQSPITLPNSPNVPNVPVIDIVKKHKFDQAIDRIAKSGNGPDEISGYLQKFHPERVKAIEKETGKPLQDIVTEYLGQTPNEQPQQAQQAPISPEIAQNESSLPQLIETSPTEQNIIPEGNEVEEKLEEPEEIKIEKGSVVGTPQGIGELIHQRNGKSLVEVNGKKVQVDDNELITQPLPEKDLADLYNDVITGIEKETGKQVSRNVDWAGYDPTSGELAYKPHGSNKLYVYDDISEEDKDKLTNFLTQRKSTGENFIGAWEAGTESPIGAAMYQLIKKLQSERGGKGNEYKNRFDSLYDALEPARTAAKRKHAEEKRKAKKPGSR